MKKSIDVVGLNPCQQRHLIETSRKAYSVREICETLGFNKSAFYYQPKVDPSEDVLRDEIETLAARYPTYGYRRISALLLRQGYTVGYKRGVSRLMREENLVVCVKRVCGQTTRSSETAGFRWVNRLEALRCC